MKIVFLTNRCSHGAKMLEAMRARGIDVAAILVEIPPPAVRTSLVKELKRKLRTLWQLLRRGEVLAILAGWMRRFRPKPAPAKWESADYYRRFCKEVIVVEDFNSGRTAEVVSRLGPDVVVLGGSRILKQHILSVPRVGTLNAHPGLLPGYPGMDVVAWAVLNGDPVGVTVHFVDAGIDSGAVVAQSELPIRQADTIESLRARAENLAAELMVAALEAVREGRPPSEHPAGAAGQPYRPMTRRQRRRAERKLRHMQKAMPP